MKSPEDKIASTETSANGKDDLTGLPGLRTWRGVYIFVFGCFILWVALLLALTVGFS